MNLPGSVLTSVQAHEASDVLLDFIISKSCPVKLLNISKDLTEKGKILNSEMQETEGGNYSINICFVFGKMRKTQILHSGCWTASRNDTCMKKKLNGCDCLTKATVGYK